MLATFGSDDGPIRQDRRLGDHDHAVADHVSGVLFGLEPSRVRLTTLTLRPMRAFLSMIARSITECAPTPKRRPAESLVLGLTGAGVPGSRSP